MNFRTVVGIPTLPLRVGYRHKLLFMGSCFTTNIGERAKELKIPALLNPFGAVYNPFSIVQSFNLLLSKHKFTQADLFYHQGLWANFAHHGSFSSSDPNKCLKQINDNITEASRFLCQADFLFITLGTAQAFRYKKTAEIVANCHKLPAGEFEQMFLSPDDIAAAFSGLFSGLKAVNPQVQIVFSVSPIRHWKDGAHGNQLSKASLLLAVDALAKRHEYVHYFPAYEIMMDELRDYRFYADDMLHPSTMAIDYIWEQFKQACLNDEALQIIPHVERLHRAMNHRPFQVNTPEYKTFLTAQLEVVKNLQARYPFLNLEKEQTYFSSGL